jgi:hypothetical protein
MKRLPAVLLLAGLSIFPVAAGINTIDNKEASGEAVAQARKMVAALFANLKEGKTEEIAKWIVGEVGYSLDAGTKIKNTAEFKSKLDSMCLSPPAGTYGQLDGYDLVDEAYLPGSPRYFRLTYLTYHEGAPLTWEFRFYVKPNGKVALHYIRWSDKNPFEYLAGGDMLLTR